MFASRYENVHSAVDIDTLGASLLGAISTPQEGLSAHHADRCGRIVDSIPTAVLLGVYKHKSPSRIRHKDKITVRRETQPMGKVRLTKRAGRFRVPTQLLRIFEK